jgi:energy-coupling factor transport system substrate-specific component
MPSSTRRLKELVIFAALGSILFISFFAMMMIPSVHVVGLLIAAYTLTYRVRALIPIYIFVMIYGILYGLSTWWIPYLYIWLPLWGMFMLVGRFQFSVKVKVPLYMLLCALHGLSFGIMYAPFQAWLFGLNFQAMVAWVIAGIPFDITHAISNFAAGALMVPLSELLKKLNTQVFTS